MLARPGCSEQITRSGRCCPPAASAGQSDRGRASSKLLSLAQRDLVTGRQSGMMKATRVSVRQRGFRMASQLIATCRSDDGYADHSADLLAREHTGALYHPEVISRVPLGHYGSCSKL